MDARRRLPLVSCRRTSALLAFLGSMRVEVEGGFELSAVKLETNPRVKCVS